MAISAGFVRNHAKVTVLELLMEGDSYPYKILQDLETGLDGQFAIKKATLYDMLKRFEKKGFVTSYFGDKTGGGRRSYYKIEQAGIDFLEKQKSEYKVLNEVIGNNPNDFNSTNIVLDHNYLNYLAKLEAQKTLGCSPPTSTVEKKQSDRLYFDPSAYNGELDASFSEDTILNEAEAAPSFCDNSEMPSTLDNEIADAAIIEPALAETNIEEVNAEEKAEAEEKVNTEEKAETEEQVDTEIKADPEATNNTEITVETQEIASKDEQSAELLAETAPIITETVTITAAAADANDTQIQEDTKSITSILEEHEIIAQKYKDALKVLDIDENWDYDVFTRRYNPKVSEEITPEAAIIADDMVSGDVSFEDVANEDCAIAVDKIDMLNQECAAAEPVIQQTYTKSQSMDQLKQNFLCDGYRIREYNSATMHNNEKSNCLVIKLLRDTCMLTFLFLVIESIIIYLLRDHLNYSLATLVKIVFTSLTIPAVFAFIGLAYPNKKTKATFKWNNIGIHCALLFFVAVAFCTIVNAAMPSVGIDFTLSEFYTPYLFTLCVPFGSIMFMILYKTGNYHTK